MSHDTVHSRQDSTPPSPVELETAAVTDPRRGALEMETERGVQGPAIFRWATVAMEHVIAGILVILLISVASNVIGRAFLNQSIPWADELARMLFIWLIFLGAAAAFARYEHVAVDYLVRKLPTRWAYVTYLIQHVIIAVLMVIILYGGSILQSRSTSRTPLLGVQWNYISVSMLVCAAFILLVALWRIWRSGQMVSKTWREEI